MFKSLIDKNDNLLEYENNKINDVIDVCVKIINLEFKEAQDIIDMLQGYKNY